MQDVQGFLPGVQKSTPVKHKHMLFPSSCSLPLITEDLPGMPLSRCLLSITGLAAPGSAQLSGTGRSMKYLSSGKSHPTGLFSSSQLVGLPCWVVSLAFGLVGYLRLRKDCPRRNVRGRKVFGQKICNALELAT